MLANWERLAALSRRRFSDENLADEALLYVSGELERDDWKRLRSFEGRSSFGSYLLHVAARLLEDFSRKKFGRVRPNKWVLERGGIWLTLFRMLCLERQDGERVADVLAAGAPGGRSRDFVRRAVVDIRVHVPDCGRSTLPLAADGVSVDDLPGDGQAAGTGNPAADLSGRQRESVLASLSWMVGDELAPENGAATRLADKVADAGRTLRLDAEDRLFLKMIYREGMNVSAAGRMLEWSASRSHSRLKSLLRELREAFDGAGIGEEIFALITNA
ncbi:hypothetical protein DND132_2914 [Pseudodesulfovibrio mercurii]|uniref:Uncharacterized protein n=1 Tax=Pseudodesulfovibrio mercurii TaxID=641491 RepID=F0JJL8_9BACT|nr:hypothetical protein [Pseudodesulfovibrio mercurii]EGB16117.1 hypothetical protein DND132_2914 [Pseudodesulfovibrio mercurii]